MFAYYICIICTHCVYGTHVKCNKLRCIIMNSKLWFPLNRSTEKFTGIWTTTRIIFLFNKPSYYCLLFSHFTDTQPKKIQSSSAHGYITVYPNIRMGGELAAVGRLSVTDCITRQRTSLWWRKEWGKVHIRYNSAASRFAPKLIATEL